MSILITFRKQLIPNRFNELLLGAINTGEGENLILASGFFQENSFSASTTTSLSISLRNNNILVTTIGVYNNIWLNQYKEFVRKLVLDGINVNPKIVRKSRWHAKIFILKKGVEPIFGIIGSSNMTRPAFGDYGTFNFESDVVLWDSNSPKINDLCIGLSSSLNSEFIDLIYANYNQNLNKKKLIMDNLKDLEYDLNIPNLDNLKY